MSNRFFICRIFSRCDEVFDLLSELGNPLKNFCFVDNWRILCPNLGNFLSNHLWLKECFPNFFFYRRINQLDMDLGAVAECMTASLEATVIGSFPCWLC